MSSELAQKAAAAPTAAPALVEVNCDMPADEPAAPLSVQTPKPKPAPVTVTVTAPIKTLKLPPMPVWVILATALIGVFELIMRAIEDVLKPVKLAAVGPKVLVVDETQRMDDFNECFKYDAAKEVWEFHTSAQFGVLIDDVHWSHASGQFAKVEYYVAYETYNTLMHQNGKVQKIDGRYYAVAFARIGATRRVAIVPLNGWTAQEFYERLKAKEKAMREALRPAPAPVAASASVSWFGVSA